MWLKIWVSALEAVEGEVLDITLISFVLLKILFEKVFYKKSPIFVLKRTLGRLLLTRRRRYTSKPLQHNGKMYTFESNFI